jgi:hypothetical protein
MGNSVSWFVRLGTQFVKKEEKKEMGDKTSMEGHK